MEIQSEWQGNLLEAIAVNQFWTWGTAWWGRLVINGVGGELDGTSSWCCIGGEGKEVKGGAQTWTTGWMVVPFTEIRKHLRSGRLGRKYRNEFCNWVWDVLSNNRCLVRSWIHEKHQHLRRGQGKKSPWKKVQKSEKCGELREHSVTWATAGKFPE